MKFKNVLKEALPQSDMINIKMASKYSGTDNPHMVDWKSGKGPETDLGKKYKKKKRKKAKIN